MLKLSWLLLKVDTDQFILHLVNISLHLMHYLNIFRDSVWIHTLCLKFDFLTLTRTHGIIWKIILPDLNEEYPAVDITFNNPTLCDIDVRYQTMNYNLTLGDWYNSLTLYHKYRYQQNNTTCNTK